MRDAIRREKKGRCDMGERKQKIKEHEMYPLRHEEDEEFLHQEVTRIR